MGKVHPIIAAQNNLGFAAVNCDSAKFYADELLKSPELENRYANDPLTSYDEHLADGCADALRNMDKAIISIDEYIAEKGSNLTAEQVKKLREVQDRAVEAQESVGGCLKAIDPDNAYFGEAMSRNGHDVGSKAYDWVSGIDAIHASSKYGMYGEISERLEGARREAYYGKRICNEIEIQYRNNGPHQQSSLVSGDLTAAEMLSSLDGDEPFADALQPLGEGIGDAGKQSQADTSFGFEMW